MAYLWQNSGWPDFIWDDIAVNGAIGAVRASRSKLAAGLLTAGIQIQHLTSLESLTSEVVGSALIEDEVYSRDAILSSIARKMGLNPWSGPRPNDWRAEDHINVLVDVVRNYKDPLTLDRILAWHQTLMSHASGVLIGKRRPDDVDVVSGALGRQTTHFTGPPADCVADEMRHFSTWACDASDPPLVMSAVAHLWFVTIHPFQDGNGRMARAIGEYFLAREDDIPLRYYSFSRAVNTNRKEYYRQLKQAQSGSIDVTPWIGWCLATVQTAMENSLSQIGQIVNRGQVEKISATGGLNQRQSKIFARLFDEFPEGISAAKWAAALSALVIAIYVISSLVLASNMPVAGTTFDKNVANVFAQQSIPAVLAVITVFYVTFTYYLLKTTHELNKSQLKPSVRLQWRTGAKPERVASTDNQNYFGDSDPAKWLILCVKNTRDKTVEELTFKLKVSTTGTYRIGDYNVEYTATEIDLGKDQSWEVGIANLSKVSNTCSIIHNLEALIYKSADSSEPLKTFSGKKSHTAQGLNEGA